MSETFLLRGARILDPAQGYDAHGDLLIRDGRVEAVADHIAPADDATVVALPASWVLAPGFVDLHAHLREPGFEAKETIKSGGAAAARGGFTTICCMPNTQPVMDSAAILAYVRDRATDAPARVRPIAAISKGESGTELAELAELAEAGAVAFSDDGRPGWPAAGEDVMLARDLALVRLTGAKYHAAHLSTAGAVELVRQAKREGLPVTAEVTPHHLLLTDAWVAGERSGPLADALAALGLAVPPGVRYDTATKVNPPLRTAADCAALLEGLRDGTIDAIATDHAPHTTVDKHCEYADAAFGISGFETALAALLALVHAGRLELSTLVAALTIRPARAWSLDAGTLVPGAPADLTIFDPDEQWTVEPDRFASRGKNTPLAGLTLRGRVRQTWLGGRLVYDAGAEV